MLTTLKQSLKESTKKYLTPSTWRSQLKTGFPLDKQAHMMGGFIIHSVFLYLVSPISALVPVAIAAIGKEFYDKKKGSTPDWVDAVATITGGLASLLVYSLLGA